jgi:3-hydroxybutyryl-CoA dehydrogenase
VAGMNVGVVGAGLMGCGVAYCAAQADHSVILLDLTDAILARARQSIVDTTRLQRLLGGAQPRKSSQDILQGITFSTDYAALANADFVIENITEKWDAKSAAYRQMDAICPPATVFACGTSAIPITRIASATRRAERVLGIHFMNPVPVKPMVELIRGFHTSDETLEAARGLLASMGKTSVLVGDSPGFVTNRVLMVTINEAIFLLHEGVASAEEVDKIFKGCFGHKMGPLETADMIGLDTILYSIEVLYESFNDSKYRPCPLLKQMVEAGLLGRKSGRGFHSYPVE